MAEQQRIEELPARRISQERWHEEKFGSKPEEHQLSNEVLQANAREEDELLDKFVLDDKKWTEYGNLMSTVYRDVIEEAVKTPKSVAVMVRSLFFTLSLSKHVTIECLKDWSSIKHRLSFHFTLVTYQS